MRAPVDRPDDDPDVEARLTAFMEVCGFRCEEEDAIFYLLPDELGLPAVVNVDCVTERIRTGDVLFVDGWAGLVRPLGNHSATGRRKVVDDPPPESPTFRQTLSS